MTECVLALFARAPLPGKVKTRLCPPLSPERAAALYRAMLLDILDQHAGLGDVERVVWYTPSESFGWFRANVPAGYRLLPQRGATLGDRMANLFSVHHREGYRRILLRGTDSPTLPPERIPAALEALERVGLVVCPDLDGGYNLIGLRGPCDPLFAMDFGHAEVCAQTLERARRTGLSFELLPAHSDVDRPEDLGPLSGSLNAERTPRTLLWFENAG